MTASNDSAKDPERVTSPIWDEVRRLVQYIEDMKLNLICSANDEERIKEALDRMGMAHRVNLHPSEFCQAGVMYVAKSSAEILREAL